MSFFKTKKFIFISIGVVIIAFFSFQQYKKSTAPIEYETIEVKRGTILQTVEATGKVRSSNDLDLRFEISGTIARVSIKEGDEVKAGDEIIRLNTATLDAAVSQASANLNQKLAGATKEDLVYYQSAVDLAKASLDQIKSTGVYQVSIAQSAVDTAKNNLKLAEGGENSEIVTNAYESAVATLQSSLSIMESGMTHSDNILGIDVAIANDDIENLLSTMDLSKLMIANSLYSATKSKVDATRSLIFDLTTQSLKSDIDSALLSSEVALNSSISLLTSVRDTLLATPPVGTLTQAILEAKKLVIETARTSAVTGYNNIISQQQSIDSAKNSLTTYTIAYDKALSDLENAKNTAKTNESIKEASYNQAVANFDAKKNPPREVDVASYRAALYGAVANRNKAILKSPIDGVVTKLDKKIGEFISVSDVAAKLLSEYYEIDVDIPETDVIKLKIGDSVSITLDAYGDDTKFSGTVLNIDPDSTEVQDVVYYKVKVTIDESDIEIKPGMTANVTVKTETKENVLNILSRSVRTSSSGKYLRVLKDGQIVEMPIVVGVRADGGIVEVIEGVQEGDEVVLTIKDATK